MPKEYWNEFRITRYDDGWTIAIYIGKLYKPRFDLQDPFWGALSSKDSKLNFGAKSRDEVIIFATYQSAMSFFSDHEVELRALGPKDTTGP